MVLILYIILVGVFASGFYLATIIKITIMKEKINIAEILKDCPKGMELDCTCADNVVFDKIIEYDQIQCVIGECREPLILDKYGRLLLCCPKCVIFPKGKTTWEGFQRPFKDGDILAYQFPGYTNPSIYIHKYFQKLNTAFYVALSGNGDFRVRGEYQEALYGNDSSARFATEEEKQKLFDAIKANGYKWNAETKTLEKLEVNKFDISTLKPFDKVLVRDNCQNYWAANLYSHYMEANEDYHFATVFGYYRQCIPYESNEHLLGTTYDCEVYFKTWK